MKRGSGCCAVDIYCTAALTSFSDSISYITYLFSEWRIKNQFTHSDSSSSAEEKWSKNDDELMHPNRVIAPQSSNKVLASVFPINVKVHSLSSGKVEMFLCAMLSRLT